MRLQIGITYSQDALCSELNISRTPVREALLELQQEGYIAFMRGKGIQVIPVTREARTGHCRGALLFGAERRTTCGATTHGAQTEALEQLLLEQESRCHDRAVRASYQLDRKFHREIFLASGNTWMQEEIEKLRDHFRGSRRSPRSTVPSRRSVSFWSIAVF